jgi:hypothetical protein
MVGNQRECQAIPAGVEIPIVPAGAKGAAQMAGKTLVASLVASSLTVVLCLSFVLQVKLYGGLYADGALYFMRIIASGHFVNVSSYRVGATILTQWPLVLAIALGEHSIAGLAAVHSAALLAVPTVCFIATSWMSRRNAIAAAANAIVICCVYYTTIFDIIGEYHILYSLFWLCSAWIVLYPPRPWWSFGLLFAAAIAMLRSYELTVITGGLLTFLCVAQALRREAFLRRTAWSALAALFVLGVPLGLWGILVPRDLANEHAFATALQGTLWDGTLLAIFGIVTVGNLAVLFRSLVAAVVAAAVAGYMAWMFAIAATRLPVHLDLLALGYQYPQRAQVFPFLLLAFVLLVIAPLPQVQAIAQRTRQQWPLLAPISLVFAMHVAELRGWRAYLTSFCTELTRPGEESANALFLARRDVRRFAWTSELLTMSVLLRSPGSNRIVSDPSYHGWEPFDPLTGAPDITRFKQSASLCPANSLGDADHATSR